MQESSESLIITSVKNSRIQSFLKLREKSSERKKRSLFIVEGGRELRLAFQNDFEITEIYVCPELADRNGLAEIRNEANKADWVEVNKTVYEKIAVRGTTEGIAAIVKTKNLKLDDLSISDNPLILVAEKVEKPGNFGALLRTADAANLDAVIICDPQVDLYNPNVVRSSLGCLFSKQIAMCKSEDAMKWLADKGIESFAATPYAEDEYTKVDFRKPSAIIVGSEAEGLSDLWLQKATSKVKIPMQGSADSLNVSVSAAIIVFEAVRQRTS